MSHSTLSINIDGVRQQPSSRAEQTMTITRRSFVGALAAGAVGLAAARRETYETYRIGIETWSFHDIDLDSMLKHVGSFGIRYLELHDDHLPRDASPDRIARAKKAFSDAGITPTGVYIHDAFTESEAVARPIFEFARTVGFRYINGGPKPESLALLHGLVPEFGVQ